MLAQSNFRALFQLDPSVAPACEYIVNSLETHDSLPCANPTCYHPIVTFGLVVLTADADVTRALAVALCTSVKHG